MSGLIREVLMPIIHVIFAVVTVAAALVLIAWLTSSIGPLLAGALVIMAFLAYLFYENLTNEKP